jgi:dUTP pyrophosphatase
MTFQIHDRATLSHITDRHHDDPAVRDVCREVLHHRKHVDTLQARCSELVHAERAARGIVGLKWKRCGEHTLPLPKRAHDGDAGLDLAVIVTATEPATREFDAGDEARFSASVGKTVVFRTGWAVEIPAGWFGLIVVRSSIGKAGWDFESSGVIDSGYRAEILLPFVFRGDWLNSARYVANGQRMAQMLLLPVPRVDSVEVSELSTTARGSGGFGSTGAT